MKRNKTLSVFIDESGDFGEFDPNAPFYLVAMILHDQSWDIRRNAANFDNHLRNEHFSPHAIHAGPLIRREKQYKNWEREERRRLFNALFLFAQKIRFKYTCIKVKKSAQADKISLTANLSMAIAGEIKKNSNFWQSFDRIIVYYDNGQLELTRILTSVFSVILPLVEFRKVSPADYKLFQVADMACTLELLRIKHADGCLSKSEKDFFGDNRTLNKNYLKKMLKKHL